MLGTITLTVGQPDGVSVAQKEEAAETMDSAIQDEVAPQVNGEKVEKESADANDISVVEEQATEEKSGDANEVGFKKIFRFVGFKFTLKKDKSEEKDPVKLLTIKDKEDDTLVDEDVKEEEAAVEEKSSVEEKEADTAAEAEVTKDTEKAENTEVDTEPSEGEVTEEEKTEKEEEPTPAQEVISPFRKLFSGGLFSNLRKKASVKKTKDEEEVKEETAKEEETAAAGEEEKAKTNKEALEEESKLEGKEEVAPTSEEDKQKEEAVTVEVKEPTAEETKSEAATEEETTAEAPALETDTTGEVKQDEEKAALEVSTEAELLSSQEKAKPHGSPLKKLFTGAGLKKLSTKKQKTKKDAETKLTESGEQAEQLLSSTESTEAPKVESGPSSPEESGEHVVTTEFPEKESSQETDGEVTSDGEKKKEGIIAWSSFKKLVTPKRRVKRPSESDDEGTAEKPAKSATLSSTESATLTDKSGEEEAKEERNNEEEPKMEATEKLSSSTEEKKKMDTSVSWEALMCMGGPKKRTRKTSDSDDDETKVEEEPSIAIEAEAEPTVEAVVATSQTSENEGEAVSSPEPVSPPASAWDTLKRMVTLKRTKSEEKPEESVEQVLSDSEAPKEESSFFLKKFFPGRRKKKLEKQASTEHGSGEEDSDTPAVVPLSEYDEPAEPEAEKQADTEAVPTNVSAEERSPSWISAAVEDDKQDQLSDIPEEAESAATPKSVDTDITEDEEQVPMSPKRVNSGRRLSTAEFKPVAPAPASETANLPKGPVTENVMEVLQAVEPQNAVIPAETSVAVEDAPMQTAAESTEYEPATETAVAKTNACLEVHARDEAMAICTGLGTKEIAKITLEKSVSPITESMVVVRDVCAEEVSIEEKPANTEQATMSENPIFEAQIHQVDTTELEPIVEKTANSIADIQVATESIEQGIEKVGIVNTELEGSEVSQPPTVCENSPQAVVIDPIIATTEGALCNQCVEVTEPTLETKEVEMDMEQLVATEENVPLEEVVPSMTKKVSTICDSTMTTTKETEPEIPVVLPSEFIAVIAETVVLDASLGTKSEDVVESEVAVAVEKTMEEDTEGEIVQKTIESQCMVLAKNVIQDAVDVVLEATPESEKPSTQSSTIPTPDQAVATTEKDVEIKSETAVVTDAPLPILCEKSSPKALHVALEVSDTIPIEVTASIDSTEENKPEDELKQGKEVNVSEETAAEEEKEEAMEESQKEEPEQSNEKAVAEEKVNDTETVEDETQSKPLELHIPVQVVLQVAKVLEEPTVEEEAAVEFDVNGTVDAPVQEELKTNGETSEQVSERLSTVSEEQQEAETASDGQPEGEKPSGKCAEVMAQVIEVIEEAVKEIEPVSTEITAAS
ncbi:A-kinase anchor protein 12b isoform X2 [Eucyclogobius newberryi]|uniref:A-kinase anchor protein 12b isoform X2 n=1 Tax=Eucyclogobius newberryi TaxID=166745 RepID=UPI003B5B2B10